MGKKKKKSNITPLPIRVPSAIRRGIIEGYSYPYVEPISIISEEVCMKNVSDESDPICYSEKYSYGSGLNAIKLLKNKK